MIRKSEETQPGESIRKAVFIHYIMSDFRRIRIVLSCHEKCFIYENLAIVSLF